MPDPGVHLVAVAPRLMRNAAMVLCGFLFR